MPEIVTPKPTKGTGILRFSKDIYLEFKYDAESSDEDSLVGYFHYGTKTVELLPANE